MCLAEKIQRVKASLKHVETVERNTLIVDMMPDLQMANVASGVFLGSQDVAHSWDLLQQHNVTHIINCATGVMNLFEAKLKYLNICVIDVPTSDIRKHFDDAHRFMRESIENGGNVLVHCNAGLSRSPTLVLSYIMRYENKTLHQALEQVEAIRRVQPNFGFVRQLEEYEKTLRQQGRIDG